MPEGATRQGGAPQGGRPTVDPHEGERDRKQKISDLRTSPGPLWRLHTWFDLFRYRLVAQREVESMTIGGADPRS